MEVKRTFDLLGRYKERFSEKTDVLAGKDEGDWVRYSASEYIRIANLLSYGLLAMGLKKGDRVASISNNRPEWNFMDMALSQAGIVHIPIYPTISVEEYTYILTHSEPRLVIVSDAQLYGKIRPLVDLNPRISGLFTYNEIEGASHWKEILSKGEESEDTYQEELEKIKDGIGEEEMVTLIYTSGTTGFPKGVMLSHRNLVTNFVSTSHAHELDHRHKVLSFLPLSHVYERMMNYHFQYKGMSIYYAENMGTIVQDLKDIKPEMFNSVPRLLERVYDRIIGKGKDLPYLKKQIFFWAVNLGLRYSDEKNGLWYRVRLKLADKLIFSKWREGMGGNVTTVVSGGASLQPRLARIFWASGIRVLEGYGLTETSPVIAVNTLTPKKVRFGTVGPVLENVEMKIGPDGEILCKGPNIMMGYYKEPELTREVIDEEGWLHTGDIGELVEGEYLKITDRKKEMFKLSSGKYIAPQVIENKMKESFFIENAMVVGENEKFASALISPNFEFLHNWASLHSVKYRDNLELISIPELINRFQKEVNEINKKLGQTEHIKRFRLVVEEWSPQSGEMSPTLKLKRKVLYENYKDVLREIYAVGKN